MFDTPVDTWYTWLGLALAGTAMVGTALSFPATAAPDATSVADTVDGVAASEYATTAEHPLDATMIRLGPRRVSLRNDGGTAHAAFAFGPVAPIRPDSKLEAVLYGAAPERTFESRRAFTQALVEAQTTEPTWRPVDRTLVVRRVQWGEQNATLVGA
ncbi:hypothetical protein AUR64_08720 [Haloprofundus marisrubri]|uniref:Uncharacterized protein n=1 Tax=Haloprofundus marisrubri TaxID=1514971 RepID=A0A0W1R9J9_9EURY|nr:hypothetical protein [Haloprofundus marisrubri]KTG09714.1 hypothetical protein AUR64_08720 [Haloprofundus marisrubri]